MKRLREDGFTLIEIAISVVVIALLLGSILGPLSVRIEQADRQKTEELLDEIKEALYGFAVANGRLPCPDTDGNGSENRASGVCTGGVVAGNLPWVDLALPELDAWGRPFAYRVTGFFADEDSATVRLPLDPPCTPTSSVTSIALCSDGDIIVKDGVGGSDVATKIPGLVVSYGANGGITPTSLDELENWPPSNVNFVSTGYRQNPANPFDDLVAWISPYILKNRMITAGRLP